MRLLPLLLFVVAIALLDPASAASPETTMVTARVHSFKIAAMEERLSGGGMHVYDAVVFKCEAPPALADKDIRVYYFAGSLPDDSELRRVGSRYSFEFDVKLLSADLLFDGALKNLRFLGPTSREDGDAR
jgi:hypothetical protein